MNESENRSSIIPTFVEKKAKFGIFLTVDNDQLALSRNPITGKLKTKKPGLRIFLPWAKKYVIPSMNIPIDYKEETYKCKDEYEISVDTAISYRVSRPEIFYSQKEALKELRDRMSSVLKRLVSRSNYRELSELRFDLKNVDPKFQDLADELKAFEEKFGISVESIVIQKAVLKAELNQSIEGIAARRKQLEFEKQEAEHKIEMAKKASDANQIAIFQEIERKKSLDALEIEKKRALYELEIAKERQMQEVYKEAITGRLEKVIDTLSRNKSISKDDKASIIRETLRGENASYMIVEGNSTSVGQGIGMGAGMSAANKLRPVTPEAALVSESDKEEQSKEAQLVLK